MPESHADLIATVRAGIGAGERLVPGTMSQEEADALAALDSLVAELKAAEAVNYIGGLRGTVRLPWRELLAVAEAAKAVDRTNLPGVPGHARALRDLGHALSALEVRLGATEDTTT